MNLQTGNKEGLKVYFFIVVKSLVIGHYVLQVLVFLANCNTVFLLCICLILLQNSAGAILVNTSKGILTCSLTLKLFILVFFVTFACLVVLVNLFACVFMLLAV